MLAQKIDCMISYFQFLAQASLVLIALYACFWCLVRKETFFQINRWILISIIAMAICLPLLPPTSLLEEMDLPSFSNGDKKEIWNQLSETPIFIETDANYEEGSSVSKKQDLEQKPIGLATVENSNLNYLSLILVLYWTVFLLLLLRFFIHTLRIVKLIFTAPSISKGGFTVVLPSKKINPFSFFHFIFFNAQHLDDQEFEQIQAHEQVHTSQWHSVDLLIAELATIFFWFNPAAWFLNRSIRQNLEYIADAVVLQSGVSKKTYQYHLLRVSIPDYTSRLTNHFNYSLLKKRIVMMNIRQSSNRTKWKYCFFLPIVMGLFVLLNNNVQAQTAKSSDSEKTTTTIEVSGNNETVVQPKLKGVQSGTLTIAGVSGSGQNISGIGVAGGTVGGGSVGIAGISSKGVSISSIPAKNGVGMVSSPNNKIGIAGGSNLSGKKANTSFDNDLILVVITAEFDQAQLDRLKHDLKKEEILLTYEDVAFNAAGKLSSIKVKVKTEDGNFNGSAMSYGDDGEQIDDPVIFYYLFDKKGKGDYKDIKTWGVVTGKDDKYIPDAVKVHFDEVKNGYVIRRNNQK